MNGLMVVVANVDLVTSQKWLLEERRIECHTLSMHRDLMIFYVTLQLLSAIRMNLTTDHYNREVIYTVKPQKQMQKPK